jgi:hypothetical protein
MILFRIFKILAFNYCFKIEYIKIIKIDRIYPYIFFCFENINIISKIVSDISLFYVFILVSLTKYFFIFFILDMFLL